MHFGRAYIGASDQDRTGGVLHATVGLSVGS